MWKEILAQLQEVKIFFSKLVQGHFSQGHEKFGEFAGLQCVAIAVYAVAFTCVKQISRWTSDTLDSIVEQGNELFKSINKHRYLGAEDIPVTVNVYDLAISVSLNFNVHGFLSRQDDHQAILQNYVHENQSLNFRIPYLVIKSLYLCTYSKSKQENSLLSV